MENLTPITKDFEKKLFVLNKWGHGHGHCITYMFPSDALISKKDWIELLKPSVESILQRPS